MKLATLMLGLILSITAMAEKTIVTYDENGNISPDGAAEVIRNLSSAVVRVDIAEAKAIVVQDTIEKVKDAMEAIDDTLKHRTDYNLITLTATGIEDAVTGNMADANVVIVDNPIIDRTSDPDNNLVKITYVMQGPVTTPKIRAKSALSGEWLEDMEQTAPTQISWGEEVAYEATIKVPKAWGNSAFFQINAKIGTAVDDGKVFDIYSESGVTGTFIVTPASRVTFRIVAGRIVNMSGTGIEEVEQ